ncbi:ras-related protein rab-26 [Anaeramoeba flamelloides]|uniref:Ras-related protein rab-26 n=1 Tax=Anaeramoeba flamelloides TaxID=1746091 RepID=A0AAV8A129_9EUKA|nr:ras-related protein rab-26 [Anaeramoeba flamelloides]
MTVGQKNIILGIWDTAGQERFNSMARMYYRKAHAAIVCYDLINRQSFEKLQQWIKELKENEANCKIYIAGTKYDLLKNHERVISKEEIEKYTNSHSAKYFETSAKTGFGIKKMFEVIAQEMISLNSKKKKNLKQIEKDLTIQLRNEKKKEKSECC